MSARILDGKATAALVRNDVRRGAAQLLAERGVQPGLAVVLVGDDPASHVYVKNKDKAAHEVGFAVRTERLPATSTLAELLAVVERLNADASVHGILVQLPLPAHLDASVVIERIDPRKDVDGLHAHNVAALAMGRPGLRPCTPAGCIEILDRHSLPLEGAEVIVIGRSMLVGKPFAFFAFARLAGVVPSCRPCGGRGRASADGQGRLDSSRRDGLGCGHQSLAGRSFGRRCRLCRRRWPCRGHHPCAWWHRPDDDCHASGEHSAGRPNGVPMRDSTCDLNRRESRSHCRPLRER